MGMTVGNGGGRGGARGDINVTPLIDIVLVLLIVFMVMTPVMLKELIAKSPQQQSDNTPQPPADNPIVVSLAAAGTVALGSEPVTVESLGGAVAERLAQVRDFRQKVVFFRIDDHARYG